MQQLALELIPSPILPILPQLGNCSLVISGLRNVSVGRALMLIDREENMPEAARSRETAVAARSSCSVIAPGEIGPGEFYVAVTKNLNG